jgi:hypothetical protein
MLVATATYDDVNLIVKLYDMRREPRMRTARAWFVSKFKATTMEEFLKICPPGSEENASYRMVTTYWEMVASFVTAGVLNQDLFLQSGLELLVVWEKARDFVPEQRKTFKNPKVLKNLETVAQAAIQYMGQEAYAAFSARIRGQ